MTCDWTFYETINRLDLEERQAFLEELQLDQPPLDRLKRVTRLKTVKKNVIK